MAATFHARILTVTSLVFEGEIASLIARGRDGYFGVLANHAPLIASLAPGKLLLRKPDGREQCFSLSGGLFEVAGNDARILADAAERPEDIDAARAAEAEGRARERLQSKETGIDPARAEAALRRAINRQRIAEDYGH